jgi:hypothetical protein
MAGSRENAVALANALRTGSPATLTYTTIAADGTVTTTTTTITPPTKPMGWGNVKHSLALAQFSLNQAGITNPTGAQLQAALQGGTVTTADGKTVALAGVLQQRADGMGWGQIAHSYGTTMGAVNHGMKAPPVTVVTTTPPPSTKPGIPTKTTNSAVPARQGVTTAGGTSTQGGQSAKGITTAGGTSAGTGQGAKGITTAGGNSAGAGKSSKGITTATGTTSGATSGGIVSADGGSRGNGNAYGRGVVTASGDAASVASAAGASSGGSSGVVTGNGAAASGVVTADPGNGAGSAKVHGKGKGGG